MVLDGHIAPMGRKGIHTKFLWKHLKKISHLEELEYRIDNKNVSERNAMEWCRLDYSG